MPIRHTKKGYYWGSQGPFPTREKALEVMRAIFASGYKGNPTSRTSRRAYFCIICNRTHNIESKLGKLHLKACEDFLSKPREYEKLTDEEVKEKLYHILTGKNPIWKDKGYNSYEDYWRNEVASEYHFRKLIARALKAFEVYEKVVVFAEDGNIANKAGKLAYEKYYSLKREAEKLENMFGSAGLPNPTLKIPIKSDKQLKHLFEAEKHLQNASVTFDTGTQLIKPIERHWELDWSLKGAKVRNPLKKVFGRREYKFYGATVSTTTAARQKGWLEGRGYHVIDEIEKGVHHLWTIPYSKWVSDEELVKLPFDKIVRLDNPAKQLVKPMERHWELDWSLKGGKMKNPRGMYEPKRVYGKMRWPKLPGKPVRRLSPYNLFIRKTVPYYFNMGYSIPNAMRLAAQDWRRSKRGLTPLQYLHNPTDNPKGIIYHLYIKYKKGDKWKFYGEYDSSDSAIADTQLSRAYDYKIIRKSSYLRRSDEMYNPKNFTVNPAKFNLKGWLPWLIGGGLVYLIWRNKSTKTVEWKTNIPNLEK